jgi:formylglycine-generating enzyme required for sulfatase activity
MRHYIVIAFAMTGFLATGCSTFQSNPSFSLVGMVEVPGGPFHYDCNEEVYKKCDDDEKPGSMRTIPTFYMDRTETTVAEYRQCVEAGVCTVEGIRMPFWQEWDHPYWSWACNWNRAGLDQHPINCIDYEMAVTYCEWRGKQVPSQEQWQKAARGTDGRTYPWGNRSYEKNYKLANIADETYRWLDPLWKIAERYNDGYLMTAPVGTFMRGASPYGALDMGGNVWEWTSSHPLDLNGEEDKEYRWTNGGAYDSRPKIIRVTYHFPTLPSNRFSNTGMRCAY